MKEIRHGYLKKKGCRGLAEGGAFEVERVEDGAVFVCKRTLEHTKEADARAASEVDQLKEIEHPFLVGYIEGFSDASGFHVVSEQATGARRSVWDALDEDFQEGVPEEVALKWAFQVATALECAHSLGVLHREVKPSNVLLWADGTCKLGDFGVGRSREKVYERATKEPCYCPPELYEQRAYTEASDIWGLGCVLYEALTGKTPLPKDRHPLHDEVTPPSAERRVRPEVTAVLLELLAKDPARRPTAGAAAIRLAQLLGLSYERPGGPR
jgi:serine/threonine protein kinase